MKNLSRLRSIMSSIKYHQVLKHKSTNVLYSKIAVTFLNFLISEGIINGFMIKNRDLITVFLKYDASGKPVFTELKKISGNRRAFSRHKTQLHRKFGNFRISIFMTPNGFISEDTALKKNTFGLLLFALR